jgi:peroxiredoxin
MHNLTPKGLKTYNTTYPIIKRKRLIFGTLGGIFKTTCTSTSLQKYDFGGVYPEGNRHFDAPRIGTT